jgi:hypothetical protein
MKLIINKSFSNVKKGNHYFINFKLKFVKLMIKLEIFFFIEKYKKIKMLYFLSQLWEKLEIIKNNNSYEKIKNKLINYYIMIKRLP